MLRANSRASKAKSPYARPQPKKAAAASAAATTLAASSTATATATMTTTATEDAATTSAPIIALDALPALPNLPTSADALLAPVPGQGTSGYPPNPSPLCSVTDALGAHLPTNIRQAIYSNEFVHLNKLLPLKANEEPQQQLAFVNGEIVIKPKTKEIKIANIESWTNAFLIYSSVYLSKFPDQIQQILKYINIVRTAAARSSSTSWLDYDIQFRLKRSRNPLLPWDTVDAELWLLYVAQYPQAQTQSTPSPKSLKCFDFNYKGACLRPYCSYQHSCLKCNNPHPVQSCKTTTHQYNSSFRYEKPKSNAQPLLPQVRQQRAPSNFHPRAMGPSPYSR